MDPDKTLPPTNLPADSPWQVRWFVANLKDCWRWLSTWAIAAAAAAPVLYENVGTIKEFVSPTAYHYIQSGLVLLIFLARIKKQS